MRFCLSVYSSNVIGGFTINQFFVLVVVVVHISYFWANQAAAAAENLYQLFGCNKQPLLGCIFRSEGEKRIEGILTSLRINDIWVEEKKTKKKREALFNID